MCEPTCKTCKKPETECLCERCLICERIVAHTHYRICDECIQIELNRAEYECRPGVVYIMRVEPYSSYEDAGFRMMIHHIATRQNDSIEIKLYRAIHITLNHNNRKQHYNLENRIERIRKELKKV